MAETSTDNSTSSAGIDLSQFYQVFFEEAGENLENMEQLLLELDITAAMTKSSMRSSVAPTRSRVAPRPSASVTWPN